jgi:long-subunit acyl-CoA synthetase (AMP-forming)
MPVQADRQELSQHVDPVQPAVQAVGEGNVDQPVLACQRHGRLRTVFRQRIQTSPSPATQHQRNHIAHLPALCVKAAGEYHWTTWRDVHSLVLRTAVALRDWGIEPGDRVAQWSENRLEWIVCDLALQWLAAVHVPLHANLPAEQAAIQILHSGATRVLVSGAAQLEKLRSVESQLPRGLACLAFDECDGQLAGRPVLQLASLVPPQLDPRNESELTDRAQSRVASGTLATILYTSGTSGGPKGVMLTHGNLASNAAATWPATGERADDLKLAFLPLSHIFRPNLRSLCLDRLRQPVGVGRDPRDRAGRLPTGPAHLDQRRSLFL